jgi:hypothetical protein
MYRLSICLIALGTLLISESWAAPPPGHGGGSSGSFGFSIGGSPGSGISFGVGNVPYHDNYGYRNQGYYNRDYYGRGNYGAGYGGSGLYLGGGSHDFRWGIGVPFGYDDYDWYAPYYNNYYRSYQNYDPGYYQGSDYYSGNYLPNTAQQLPAMEHPPIPTAGQVARLTDEQLRMMIAVALDNYNKDLDGFTTGAGWKIHFKLAELKTHVTGSQIGSPDASTRTLIADISQKFEAAEKDPSYEVITQPWSFQTLLVALKEYSLPAVKRQGHVLNAKAQTLKRSLDNISTGAGWKAYLEINELDKLLGETSGDNAELTKKLEKILERFDDVSQNQQYKVVAELQGFDVTRTALQQYIHTLQMDTVKPDASAQPKSL